MFSFWASESSQRLAEPRRDKYQTATQYPRRDAVAQPSIAATAERLDAAEATAPSTKFTSYEQTANMMRVEPLPPRANSVWFSKA